MRLTLPAVFQKCGPHQFGKHAEQVEMPGGGSKTPLSEMSEEMQKMYSEAEALMSEVDSELPFLNGTTEEPKQETQDWFSWVVRAHLP